MSAEIVVLSDYRTARRRQAAQRDAVASCETLMQAGFITAFAWLNAMDDLAKAVSVPWPGGIDDLGV